MCPETMQGVWGNKKKELGDLKQTVPSLLERR